MATFTKQFALIDKITSLVKKSKISVFKRTEEYDITEEAAKKIQKKAFELSHAPAEERFTAPYLVLAEQLQINDNQIYRAVVSTLAKIAVNDGKNAKEIITLIEDSLSFTGKTQEQKDYARDKVSEIKKI